MCETLPFKYFCHVNDYSVQCAIGTRNHETTVPLHVSKDGMLIRAERAGCGGIVGLQR